MLNNEGQELLRHDHRPNIDMMRQFKKKIGVIRRKRSCDRVVLSKFSCSSYRPSTSTYHITSHRISSKTGLSSIWRHQIYYTRRMPSDIDNVIPFCSRMLRQYYRLKTPLDGLGTEKKNNQRTVLSEGFKVVYNVNFFPDGGAQAARHRTDAIIPRINAT